MARIMLINAPLSIINPIAHRKTYFPFGILSIATFLKHEGIETVILDAGNYFAQNSLLEPKIADYIEGEVISNISVWKPDIIGIGALFSGAFGMLRELAKGIKKKFPYIPIVIGGAHATIFAKEIMQRYKYIDFVIIGEGEYSFLNLIKSIIAKQNADKIDGIAFRQSGRVKINPKTEFIDNLDALPFVDYNLIDCTRYNFDTSAWYSPKKIKIDRLFPISSSRSCHNRCSFCCMRLVHGAKFRARSAKHVLDELELLYHKHSARYFEFIDDNLTCDKYRILEICNGIVRKNLNIQFATPNGIAINKLDQEIVDALVTAGMIRIALPIEHGSEYIRNRIMKKGLSTKKIYQIAEACAKHSHLYINGYFIIGMPQETQKTLDELYNIITSIHLDSLQIYYATPYPGTDLFSYCINHNLISQKNEYYMTSDHLYQNVAVPHFKPYELTVDELIDFRKKCFEYQNNKRSISGVAHHIPMRNNFSTENLA